MKELKIIVGAIVYIYLAKFININEYKYITDIIEKIA